MRNVGGNLAVVTQPVDGLAQVVAADAGLGKFYAGRGLDDIGQLVREGRDAAAEVRELAAKLRQEPSRLFYEPPPVGVEIPR